jgi:hypothetical protein
MSFSRWYRRLGSYLHLPSNDAHPLGLQMTQKLDPRKLQEMADCLARIQRKKTLGKIARALESESELEHLKAAYHLGLITLELQEYAKLLYELVDDLN